MTDVVDAQGIRFGIERVRQIFSARREARAQAICDHLLEVSASHRAETPQFDDITLVAVRVA